MRKLLLSVSLLTTPVCAEVPRVSTDVLPVHGLVSDVMGALGTPDLVVSPSGDAHHYSMRPSEARALSEADIVFHMGEALTPWFGDAATTLSADAVQVELLDLPQTYVREARETAVFSMGDHDDHEDHDDHDEHEDHDEHDDHEEHGGHDGHDHGGIDPHAWLWPDNAIAWLDVIAATLADADPENADAYAANAAAAAEDIAAAKAEVAAMIAATPPAPFAVLHDAYGYYEEAFGLEVAGAITSSDSEAPGAARIAELRAALSDAGIACVMSEPSSDPRLARTVFGDLSVIVADPLGRDLEQGAGFYPALVLSLGEAFVACQAN